MSYFKSFNPTLYKFGNESSLSLATNLTQYSDLVDLIKVNDTMLNDFIIPRNERPDQTSFRIYGNTDFYWTFFLTNDHIRERGWPLTLNEVRSSAIERYPHRMVTMKLKQPDVVDYYDDDNKPIYRTKLIGTAPDNFEVGRVVEGSISGTKGVIIKRDLSLGTFVIDTTNVVTRSQVSNESITPNSNGIVELERIDLAEAETFTDPLLWVLSKDGVTLNVQINIDDFGRKVVISGIAFDPTSTYTLSYFVNTKNLTDGTFTAGEEISYPNPAGGQTSGIVHTETDQYNGTHHYQDASGNWVDVNPLTQAVPSGAIEITLLENLELENEALRKVKVLKKNVIKSVANDFNKVMNEV
ncbi:baseplate wedge protein 53 [bacterium]|nr:baseplate wedge protein 53 [bacterium]